MSEISQIISEARKKIGLSVDELSERTKIRKVIIENLEKGNFEEFQDLYLKAYIRSIAKELKIIDSPEFMDVYREFSATHTKKLDETTYSNVQDFDSEINTKPEKKKKVIKIDDEAPTINIQKETLPTTSYNPKSTATKQFKTKPKLNSNILVYTLLIIFLLGILLITFWPASDPYEIEPPKLKSNAKSKTIEIGEDNSDKGLLDFFKQSDSLYLKAEVSDTVWFSMIIDKKTKVQTSLVPSQTYEWTAAQEFKVTHGNAGKIKLYLNDKLLAPFAPAGYVAKDVIITADKIINNNAQRVDSVRTFKKKKAKTEEPEFRFIEPSNIGDFEKNINK